MHNLKIDCENSEHEITFDFAEVRKIVEASDNGKVIKDYELIRYTFYLIIQNNYKSLLFSGKKIRGGIKKIEGTMLKDLPVPEKSIQQTEKEQRKRL